MPAPACLVKLRPGSAETSLAPKSAAPLSGVVWHEKLTSKMLLFQRDLTPLPISTPLGGARH
eukprot:6947391-Pyramimonas_sp.AAC.1